MFSIQMEISFLKEFDRLLRHASNLELESAVGSISIDQLLRELQDINKKAEDTLDALRENKKEDAGDEQGQARRGRELTLYKWCGAIIRPG
jgi:hypothetical protein